RSSLLYINSNIFVRSEDRDFNYEPIFDCLLKFREHPILRYLIGKAPYKLSPKRFQKTSLILKPKQLICPPAPFQTRGTLLPSWHLTDNQELAIRTRFLLDFFIF
uniref:hypothetical protein n=2 Tax=Bacteroides uniformis TaxID=820 RepID=UPI004028FC7D